MFIVLMDPPAKEAVIIFREAYFETVLVKHNKASKTEKERFIQKLW